jgi:alkanesulfonate monooxygenase SsuD/methylene tetrahydromethanopterin reductase-like flavin-dependent oxidoreductase (luciferase family)
VIAGVGTVKAFNEEAFSYQGKHYTLPPRVPYRGYELQDITLVPRLIHRPVEIWQLVASSRSLEFMARHGLKGMLALNGEKLTEQIMHRYQELNAKYGRELELGENICLGMGFCIADSHEQGCPWGTPGASARLPHIEDGVQQKAWLCGPPEHLIAKLRQIEAKYPGLEHVMFQWLEGMPLQEFKEQLRLLRQEVMPAFTHPAGKHAAR